MFKSWFGQGMKIENHTKWIGWINNTNFHNCIKKGVMLNKRAKTRDQSKRVQTCRGAITTPQCWPIDNELVGLCGRSQLCCAISQSISRQTLQIPLYCQLPYGNYFVREFRPNFGLYEYKNLSYHIIYQFLKWRKGYYGNCSPDIYIHTHAHHNRTAPYPNSVQKACTWGLNLNMVVVQNYKGRNIFHKLSKQITMILVLWSDLSSMNYSLIVIKWIRNIVRDLLIPYALK